MYQPVPPTNDSNLPSFLHPSYLEMQEELELVQDCWADLKARKDKYIGQEIKEPAQAYRDRLARCAFDNRFAPAIQGYAGLLNDFTLTSDIAPSIEAAKENIDLQGNDLHTFWNQCDELALKDTGCGILVEFPPVDRNIQSNADFLESGRRPYLIAIDRRDIINWDGQYINGIPRILRATIAERRLEPEGLYGVREQTYYRVLVPGSWHIYQVLESGGKWVAVEVESGLTSLDVVPLVYYSVCENKLFQGKPPFLNLARLNIEHFQKRSQLNEVLRKCNLPVPVRKGLVKGAADLKNLPPLVIGPNSVLDIPADGDFFFAEPSGSAIAATQADLVKLEAAMDRVSLAFLTGGEVERTATEVVLNSAQTQASLRGMARRKASAVEQVFNIWTSYTGESNSGSINLNESILQLPLTSQLVQQIASLAEQGLISQRLLLTELQRGKIISKDIDIESEVADTQAASSASVDPEEVLAA